MICASDLDRVAGPCMVRKLSLTSVSTTRGQRDIRVVVVVIVLSLLLHGTWASKVIFLKKTWLRSGIDTKPTKVERVAT